MKERILIIGAGGFGREILGWVEDEISAGAQPTWEVGGFLDAQPNALTGFDVDLPVVGDPREYVPRADDRLICAIGDPQTKLTVCETLQKRGGIFPSWVHHRAYVGARSRIGTGTILLPFSFVTVDSILGDFVTLNARAGVGHDARIGDGCTVNSCCDITGGVQLGRGVLLGSNVSVVPRVKVGDFAKIGAGSVVYHRVKSGTTVIGVPAKRVDMTAAGGAAHRPAA